MREALKRWVLPAALLVGGLALLGACGGGGEQGKTPPPADGSPQASPGQTPQATASPTAGFPTCPPDSGPPATGSGPDELRGRISFVRLVFGCSPDVYVMDANGDGATNISNDPAMDDESDISPDGKKVVFFSLREGQAFIYVVNADGSDFKRLTNEPGGDASPRWSPDGSRIAFSRGGDLAVMNAKGGDLKIIMEAQPAVTAEPCRAGSFVGGWSPDGLRITYYSAALRQDAPTGFWICAIDADGSNLEVLVSEPEGELHAEPHWSPDGKRIVYREEDGSCARAGTEACNYEIYVFELGTRKVTNVTNHRSLDIEPVWSPDGEWILFASNRDDPNFDLYVVHPDGTGLRRLLDDPTAKDSYPSWAP